MEAPAHAVPPAVNLPTLSEVEKQAEGVDISHIAEIMTRHADVVDSVTYVGQNLAGTSTKKLRLAVLVMKAGTKILLKGTVVPPDVAREEVEALRRKVEGLKRGSREKDVRIVELERRCDELRNVPSSGWPRGGPPISFCGPWRTPPVRENARCRCWATD